MKGRKKTGDSRIRRVVSKDHGFSYQTFQVVGFLNGERVRKKFKSRQDALGEINRLAVLAANSGGIVVQPVNTRLTPEQVRGAELAIKRLGTHALKDAVDWFLANYRPPLVSTTIENAAAEYMRDREGQVSTRVIRDYRKVMRVLLTAFSGRKVDAILTSDLETVMGTWAGNARSPPTSSCAVTCSTCLSPGSTGCAILAGCIHQRSDAGYSSKRCSPR